MQKRQTLTKLLPAALICAAVLSPAGAAEAKNEITVAVASTFTTMARGTRRTRSLRPWQSPFMKGSLNSTEK